MVEPIKNDSVSEEFDKVRIKAKAQEEYEALTTNKLGENAELERYEERDYLLVQSVIPHWLEGKRNQLCMNLAGFLRKKKYLEKHVCTIIREICEATKDKELKERLAVVKATYKKPLEEVKGYSGLKDIIPFEALKGFKEKKNEEEEREIRTSSYILNNKLYEQIYDSQNKTARFMIMNSNPQTITHFFDGDKTILPIIGEELDKEAVLLPSGIEEYGTVQELITELKDYIHTYVDVSPQYETFSTWYVLLTWIYDRLDTINYMRVMGDTGLGKTRYLDVIGRICYKPIIVAGAVGVAPIFRLIEKWSGTLIIDEADFGNTEEKDEIIKILNCGFQRGTPVVRCDKNDPNKIMFFKVYCPKIISTRRQFTDKALESRCLTHRVYMTKRKDIPDTLGSEFTNKQKTLRNKLLKFRFDNYYKITKDENLTLDLGNIEPRLKQATRSFAAMFSTDEKATDEFKNFLIGYNKELIQERSGSFDGDIVNVIHELLLQGQNDISSQDILNYMKVEKLADDRTNVRSIGKHLASLNILTKKRRVGNKNQNFIVFDDFEVLKQVFLRYIPDYNCSVVPFVPTSTETGRETAQTSETTLNINRTDGTNRTDKNVLSPYVSEQMELGTDFELPQEEYLKSFFSDGELLDWIRNHDLDGLGAYEGDIMKTLDVGRERLVRLAETGLIYEFRPGRYKTL